MAVFGTQCRHILIHAAWKLIFISMFPMGNVFFISWVSRRRQDIWSLLITRRSFLLPGPFMPAAELLTMGSSGEWRERIIFIRIWMPFQLQISNNQIIGKLRNW